MSKKNKNRNKDLGNYYVAIVVLIVISDQLAKYLVQTSFDLYESLVIIPGVFKLTYIINTGAGFGILQNFNSLLLFISLFVLGTILFYWDTLASVFEKVSMSFIVGGIMGNMIDRIAHGSVIDFLEVPFWPAFNIADTMICIGVLGLLYYEIKYE